MKNLFSEIFNPRKVKECHPDKFHSCIIIAISLSAHRLLESIIL